MPTAHPDPSPDAPAFDRVCVFCGSSPGRDPRYLDAARATGRYLAESGIQLVYGGGSAGLMGALADAALDAGGEVIGVLPSGLFPDGVTASPLRPHHAGSLEVVETDDMHARKATFHSLSDAFLVLPGGLGTLEEAAEAATWAQIGLHEYPIGFLDVGGYFDALLAWLERAVADGFLRDSALRSLQVGTDPAALLEQMAGTVPPREPKWMRR